MQRPRIDMHPSVDTDGKTYHIGRVKAPVKFEFHKGMAFLFYPEMESPELHFCPLDSEDLSDVFDVYKQKTNKLTRAKHGNLPIDLSMRRSLDRDGNNRKFYVGKIKFNGTLDATNGLVFLAFTADENDEELQIAKANVRNEKSKSK